MIFVNNEIFAKVWKVSPSENGKYIDLQISTSEKNENGEYINSPWYPRCIGHSVNSLKGLKEGDRIVISKSKLTNDKFTDKDNNTRYKVKFVILEAKISDNSSNNTTTEKTKEVEKKSEKTEDESIPW